MVLVTLVLLITAVLKHGWAALTPTPFWGWLGFWGVWGAAVTALDAETTLVVARSVVGPSCQMGHREAPGDGDGDDGIYSRGWYGCAAAVQKRRPDSCLDVCVSHRVSHYGNMMLQSAECNL